MSTFASMMNYTRGHTVISHEIVDKDPRKTGWSIEDVPLFVRIDHPKRPISNINKGTVKSIEVSENSTRRVPLMFWIKGLVYAVESSNSASTILQITISRHAREALKETGWYRMKNGIVVWLKANGDAPECVPRPLVFAK